MRSHQVKKFGAIPSTDVDGLNQSTLDFLANCRILGLKNCWGRPIPMRYALASVGHPLQTVKFLGSNAQPEI